MATLHRIVLATAGSWNNGTSSPAPQGNRAWSNETTALAERQEPTSAETPPILNPIGKGIGKFWIPILLVTAAMLTTSIEQAGAASASTNQITRQTPPSYRSKSPTSFTNRVIPARRNIALPPSRTVVPTRTSRTNQLQRPSRRIARTNQVQTPSRRTTPAPTRRTTQPAAVPIAAPAAPVIKKAVCTSAPTSFAL